MVKKIKKKNKNYSRNNVILSLWSRSVGIYDFRVDKMLLKKMIDLNKSEAFTLTCLAIPTLYFGFYPDPLINTIEVSVSDLIEMYNFRLVSKF